MKYKFSFFSLGVWLLPLAVHAQLPNETLPLRYKFTAGERLRYLIMRDPYFADPAKVVETTDYHAPRRFRVMERLTEEVQSVQPDGTATIKVTLEPEPGFEDNAHPGLPLSQTLTVTPLGQMLSPAALSSVAGFLRPFFRLPAAPAPLGASWRGVAFQGPALVQTALTLAAVRDGGHKMAVITQAIPPLLTKSTSPDHDGTLLQTTSTAQRDRIVFDNDAGNLLRLTSALTVNVSLTITNRGRRGSADFGRVIPSLQTVQTMTIERKEDTLPN